MIYTVYLRTNKINGKQYVGQTKNFRKRENCWNCYKELYANKLITEDRNKYGLENFETTVLAETEDKAEAWKLERQFVKQFNTKVPNGYNISDGGKGPVGTVHSEETKHKWSLAKIGKPSLKRKEIVQVKDGRVVATYPSSFVDGYTQSAISSCCNGKFNKEGNHHYKGFDWYFRCDYEKMLGLVS